MVSFQGKYQILSALNDGESQSFRALQISSGRSVLVHHLAPGRTPPDQPDLASLIFSLLRRTSAEKSRYLLDMGEDEGRIFVVTADVPECLDLRKWLQSAAEAQAGKVVDAQPAAEGTPDFGNLDFTSNFTTEAMRQVSSFPASAPVPTPEKSSTVLKPPPEIPAASPEVADSGLTGFAGLWEKTSPASLAGDPPPVLTPPTSPQSPEGPSGVSEATAKFLSMWASFGVREAPTAAMTTLDTQAADRERAPAAETGPAEAKGNTGRIADLVLTPSEVKEPPGAASVGEVSISSPHPAMTPVANGSEAKTPGAITELLVPSDKAPPQSVATASAPNQDDKQEAEVKSAEKVPRRQIPMGFEVVFQSSKPRSRPTLSGLPDQSGIMAAPAPIAPPTAPEESAPPPAAAGLPSIARPVVSPPAEKIGGSPAMGSPHVPGEQWQAAGARKEPTRPPTPPPAQPAPNKPEPVTRLVSAPPVLSARPAPLAPLGDYASKGGAAPPVSAPIPIPPNRAQPDEYTRMIENGQGLAGPLPPVGPPANPAVPAPMPFQATYLNVPAPQPPPYPEAPPQLPSSLYIPHDTPAHSAGKKRKGWVPILILSSLFLMTMALLLFFALKH